MRLKSRSDIQLYPCECGTTKMPKGIEISIIGVRHRIYDPCYMFDDKISDKIGSIFNMNFTSFVRKPFVVEAVEVTAENIAEVAKYVGDLREKEDGTPYILVDRRLVPNVFRVYPGFFMTRMGENVRCYSRKIFKEQFIQQTDEIKPWVEFMTRDSEKIATA
jgi:hypothetical protein